jgi:hypothetical protein
MVAKDFNRVMLFFKAYAIYKSPQLEIKGNQFWFFEYLNKYMKKIESANAWLSYQPTSFYLTNNTLDNYIKFIYEVDIIITPYDEYMKEIYKTIRRNQPTGDFCLLGVDSFVGVTMNNLLAKSFFNFNLDYKNEITPLLNEIDEELYCHIEQQVWQICLYKEYQDEIQAILATGIYRSMDNDHFKGIITVSEKFESVFHNYINELESDLKNWSQFEYYLSKLEI